MASATTWIFDSIGWKIQSHVEVYGTNIFGLTYVMGMVYAKKKPTTNSNKKNWSNWFFINYILDVSNVVIN